jgi:hypothetical protein
MRNLVAAVTCVLALCCLALPNSMPVAQDKAFTLETPSKTGKRLSTDYVREYTEKTDVIVAGEVNSTTTNSFWVSGVIHEWHMAVGADGKPQRVMRTYEKLKRESASKMYLKMIDNTQESARAEVSEPLKGLIIVYDIAADGARKALGDAPTLIWEHDRARSIAPYETSMLPGKAVKVGDSWTVAGKDFEKLYERTVDLLTPKEDPQPWESGDITVKVRATDGEQVALDFSGELTFRLRQKAAYGDEEVTNYVTTAKVNGELIWQLGVGPVQRRLAADITRTGKVNGFETRCNATLNDVREYRNSWLFEAARDAGSDGAPAGSITEAKGFAGEAVATGNVVISRNSKEGARLVEFDPVSGKYVRCLCVVPAGKFIDHVTLSADRKRVAFASTLNNEISISPWSVFVLEITTGKINQVTPSWASNDGIAPELKTSKTGTIIGRVEFYDDYERATRSDGISASAHVDQTRCQALIGNTGAFRIDNVPEGILLVSIKGTVPRPRHGVAKDHSVGMRDASVVTLVNIKGGETTDCGTLRMNIGAVDMVYCNPTWNGETLAGHLHGVGMMWQTTYPRRAYALDTAINLPASPTGFGFSPDGKQIAITTQDGHKLMLVDPATRKATKTIEFKDAGAEVAFSTRLTWMTESMIVTGGMARCRYEFMADCPALIDCALTSASVKVVKTWPEWSGRKINDVALTPDGNSLLLCVQGPLSLEKEDRIELYLWTPETDTTTRLTSTGEIQSVSNAGR